MVTNQSLEHVSQLVVNISGIFQIKELSCSNGVTECTFLHNYIIK